MIKLRWYQKEMISYGLNTIHLAYFVDMRLGKTKPVIRMTRYWIGIASVLIVAPYSAFMGWRDELKKEGQPPAIELSKKTQARRDDLFNYWGKNKYFMISKEGFLWLPEIKDMSWDVVILDESTFIKNYNTQVTKFFVKNFREVKHRVIMTGLPNPESELDFHSQLEFLDPNIIPMKHWNFRTKYFLDCDHELILSKKGRKYLSQRLAQYCYFLTRKEAGIGSEKIYETRLIQCPNKVLKVYNTLKTEFIYELDEEFRVTKYATVKFNWMRKLLGGMFDGKRIWDGKCAEIKYLINNDLKGQPLIIWCQYIEEILFLQDYFNEYFLKKYKKNAYKRKKIAVIYGEIKKVEREKIIIKFQKGLLDWIFAQPTTLRYATDFSRAPTMIYYSMPGRETRRQTEDRFISAEMTEPKLLIDLIVENTVEEGLYTSFKLKEQHGKVMYKIIKNIMRGA